MEKTTALSKTTTILPSLQHTQAAVVALRDKQTFGHLLANVPRTIEQVLDRPAVSALINAGAKKESVEACLSLEILKTSSMITAGGNLREGHALEIAIQLIAEFPNESLEDFCLCLRRGLKGSYGDIFRFDAMVIFGWFRKYLEEKYEAIETRLMREKDNLYNPGAQKAPTPSDPDAHQKWLDKLKEATAPLDEKKIPPLTSEDIRLEGQERPKAKFHPYTPVSVQQQQELHREWIRQNFDKYTGDKLPTWKEEREWLNELNLRE